MAAGLASWQPRQQQQLPTATGLGSTAKAAQLHIWLGWGCRWARSNSRSDSVGPGPKILAFALPIPFPNATPRPPLAPSGPRMEQRCDSLPTRSYNRNQLSGQRHVEGRSQLCLAHQPTIPGSPWRPARIPGDRAWLGVWDWVA